MLRYDKIRKDMMKYGKNSSVTYFALLALQCSRLNLYCTICIELRLQVHFLTQGTRLRLINVRELVIVVVVLVVVVLVIAF